jgi:opacity protein-like surface antigen
MKRFLFVLMIISSLPSIALSQTDLGIKAVGAKAGFILPDTMDDTIGFGLVTDLGTIDMFSLSAYIDYWSKSYTNYLWDWKWDVISVAVVGKYSFNLKSPIKPYVGAGMGFDVTNWQSEFNPRNYAYEPPSDPNTSESDFDLAVHLLGGARYTISPVLDGFFELKYTTGGIDYFGVYGGVMYKLK